MGYYLNRSFILCAWWAISSHNRQAANQAATDRSAEQSNK